MAYADTEKHLGEVVELGDNRVKVLIRSASACSACHAKGACTASDFQDKYIESRVTTNEYALGEKVIVECNDRQGFYALFWAYVFPLILMLVLLFVGLAVWNDELKAGLLSLGVLPFYYLFLFLKNKVFEKKLQVKIKKIAL